MACHYKAARYKKKSHCDCFGRYCSSDLCRIGHFISNEVILFGLVPNNLIYLDGSTKHIAISIVFCIIMQPTKMTHWELC